MPPSQPAEPARILLVEDDISLLGALRFALEADGYYVAAAMTGADTIAFAGPADCLVVDLKLPDMDGLSLIARLRGEGVAAPAILITSNPDERCRRAAMKAGVQIVEKPLVDGQLRDSIAAAVGRRPSI